jgi:predicted permease
MTSDIRHALRALRRAPGFAALVIATLALGIGATTAIFSVVHGVLLRPLPYREAERLVTVSHFYPSLDNLEAGVSAPGFADYRDRARSLASVAVRAGWQPNLTGLGEPERLQGARVSGAYFSTLGVSPALGRALRPDEDEPGRQFVVVLSDGFWRRRFGADPRAVGRTVVLNGQAHEIVGVMPPRFRDVFGPKVELWRPLALTAQQLSGGRTNEWLSLVARLAPGVTLERSSLELRTLATQLKREYPDDYPPDWTLKATDLRTQGTGKIRPALLVLLGAVGFVLLIAAANVANLLLARGAGRLREVAVRTALGARRGHLVRQLLVESVVLALAGGALGVALAVGGVRALGALAPDALAGADVRVDGVVLAFALGVSMAVGLLFGLAPALQTSRPGLQGVLREGGRGSVGDGSAQLARRVLVVAEVALALVLLTGAGLLGRSFAQLQRVSPGFDPRGVLTLTLALPQAKYPADTQRLAFFEALLPRLAAIPGVQAVGAVSDLPFGGGAATSSFTVEGHQPPEGTPGPWGDYRVALPGFHETLRIPLRRGRLFGAEDGPGARRVAIVDEETARRFWPGQDPIGKRISYGTRPGTEEPEWLEIVGVVGHARQEGLDDEPRPQVYLPYRQSANVGGLSLALRTAGNPERLVPLVREAVRGVDRDQPLSDVRTMEARIDASVGSRRLSTFLLGLFASVALVMACLGLYGLMAYAVAQRTRELGLRMALGAPQRSVLGLVVRQGLSLTLVGSAIGVAGSLGLARVIESQLYATRATDPLTLGAVVVLLTVVTLLATLVPARRATRIDPVTALRAE